MTISPRSPARSRQASIHAAAGYWNVWTQVGPLARRLDEREYLPAVWGVALNHLMRVRFGPALRAAADCASRATNSRIDLETFATLLFIDVAIATEIARSKGQPEGASRPRQTNAAWINKG